MFGHLLLALIDLAAGFVALVWPGPTALVLVLVVAIWAVMAGFAEIFSAFGSRETAGTRALFIGLRHTGWARHSVRHDAPPEPGHA